MENKDFLDKYNELMKQLIELFPNKETLVNLPNENKIIELGNDFYDKISNNKIYRRYLLERKNKLFQIEKKLILNNTHMHKLLNSLDNTNQSIVWEYLQLFYILLDKNDSNYVSKLAKSIADNRNKSSSYNTTADDILNDIKSSIVDAQNGGNIFNSILETSQKIAGKYKDKLASGEITFKDMMGSLKNSAGLDENTSEMLDKMMDEDGNLKMEEVLNNEAMKNMPGMENMQGLLSGMMGNSNMFGNLMGSIFKDNQQEVPELTEDQMKEINEFYSSMDMNELSKVMGNLEKK
jgi:hypothetical protein